MNGSYLLDTNIIISLFAGEESTIIYLEQADEIFIPSIVIGELHYGAHKSRRVQDNIKRIEELTTANIIFDCNTDTARQYGIMKNKLRQKGRPLPENNIWIAALAIQYNLVLVTRDAHFQHVEGLQIMRW